MQVLPFIWRLCHSYITQADFHYLLHFMHNLHYPQISRECVTFLFTGGTPRVCFCFLMLYFILICFTAGAQKYVAMMLMFNCLGHENVPFDATIQFVATKSTRF